MIYINRFLMFLLGLWGGYGVVNFVIEHPETPTPLQFIMFFTLTVCTIVCFIAALAVQASAFRMPLPKIKLPRLRANRSVTLESDKDYLLNLLSLQPKDSPYGENIRLQIDEIDRALEMLRHEDIYNLTTKRLSKSQKNVRKALK